MILLLKASEADYAKRYRQLLARRTDGSPEAMASEDARLAALAGGGGPSQAQAEAGNYRKKHIRFQGLDIAIENPRGSVRRGRDRGGHEWAVKMQADYGYVNGSMGVDGDQVDVYIGPDAEADTAYIVTTMAPPGFAKRDENKCMLGYASEAAAKAAFLAHYDNPKFFGGMLAMPMDEFKAKVLATKDAPKFIKGIAMGEADIGGGSSNGPVILFLKASVGPYMRNGKMVNLKGYHGRDKKSAPPPGQMALFPAPEKKPMGPSPFSEDHMRNPEKHTPDMFVDADEHGEVPPGRRVDTSSDSPEASLRAMWTERGVPKERQDELIRQIEDKAKPGAKVGPFTVGRDGPDPDEVVPAGKSRKFYVTMRRDQRTAWLAGPFDHHEDALAHVGRARDAAYEADPRSHFDAFGTASFVADDGKHHPGVLNERLGVGRKTPSS